MDDKQYLISILLRAREQVSQVAQKVVKSLDEVVKAEDRNAEAAKRAAKAAQEQRGALEQLRDSRIREKKLADEAVKSYQDQAAALRSTIAATREQARVVNSSADSLRKQRDAATAAATAALREADALRDAARARAETAGAIDKVAERQGRQAEAARREADRNRRLAASYSAQIKAIESQAAALDKSASAYERNAAAATRSASAQARTSSVASNAIARLTRQITEFDARQTETVRSTDRFGHSLRRLGGDGDDASKGLRGLNAELQGFAVAAAIKYAQSLISALAALAGQLVAVAAAAGQAAIGLGAALSAGMAQAVPVVGVLAAAFARLGSVLKAVKLQNDQQLTSTRDASEAARRQSAAADSIRAAEERVQDAHRNSIRTEQDLTRTRQDAARDQARALRDVTEARREAIRVVQDLIAAEEDQEQTVEQARASLRAAERSGDVGAAVQAEIGLRRARTGLSRARQDAAPVRSQGVRGTQVFQDAEQRLADARRNSARQIAAAERQVADALRAERRATEDLSRTRAQAVENLAQETAAVDKLKDSLDQLTPAERRLYRRLLELQEVYRRVSRPITDIIVGAFSDVVDRVVKVIQDPRVLRGFRNIATEVARSIRSGARELSGDDSVGAFRILSDEAVRNIPIATRILTSFFRTLRALVLDAIPAFRLLLTYVEDYATRLEAVVKDNPEAISEFFQTGVRYARSFFELGLSILNLLLALGGQGGAAAEGTKTIDGLADVVDGLTAKVRANAESIRRFFEQTRGAFFAILSVVGRLGLAIAEVFSERSVRTFADFLNRVVIPAIVAVVRIMGILVTISHEFLALPFVSDLAQWAAALILLSRGLAIVGKAFYGIAAAIGFMKKEGKWLFVGNPWILGITAIIAALALLDSKFGIFDKFGNLFKSGAEKAIEAADKFTAAINRQIEALRRQRDAEIIRQNSRLSLARAEIASERARAQATSVGGIDLRTGRIDAGARVTQERREASLNLKQAILDEKQARISLQDARKEEQKTDKEAIGQSKKTIDLAKKRIDTLKDERSEIEKRIDRDKKIIEVDERLLKTLTPGTDRYRFVTQQLADAKKDLGVQEDLLRGNSRDLRKEAERSKDAFDNWRKSVRRAGGNAETFADTVESTMQAIADDVNAIMTQFGAKEIKFPVKRRKKTKVESGDAYGQLTGTPSSSLPGGFPGRQTGGYASRIPVPGSGTGDKVRMQAMLEPGEDLFVLNRNASSFMRGLEGLNKAVPRFATGGRIVPIPGMPGESIDRRILGDLLSIIRQYKVRVTDGYAPTGHKSAGEHPLGLAVDLVPGSGGSWDLVDRLARWAEPNQNNPRFPFRWVGYNGDIGHGRGDHLHLSWLHSGLGKVSTLGGEVGGTASVRDRVVGGPDGILKSGLQGASNRVVRAANRYIERELAKVGASSTGLEDAATFPLGRGSAGKRIFDYFKGRQFSDNQAAAWVGNFQQESALNPGAIQPGGPGRGLAQWGGGRFDALVAFAKRRKKPWQDMQTQLDFVWHELQGTEAGAYGKIKAARSLVEAVDAIGRFYERFGIQGNRLAPAQAAYDAYANRAKGGHFQVGGAVPGYGGGDVYPAWLEGGEHVWTKGEVERAGGHGAMYAMRSMMGYRTGGPVKGIPERVARPRNSVNLALSIALAPAVEAVNDLLSDAAETLRTTARGPLRRSKNLALRIQRALTELTEDGGTLDKIRLAVDSIATRAAARIQARQFIVGPGGPQRASLGDSELAELNLQTLRSTRGGLTDEREAIQRGINAANRSLREATRRKDNKAIVAATTALANLRTRLGDNTTALAQNAQDQVETVESFQQALLQSVTDAATHANAGIDRWQRVARALGQQVDPNRVLDAQIGVMRTQITGLQGVLSESIRTGNITLAQQVRDSIDDLNVQITEAVAQQFQNSIDAVNDQAQREGTRLDRLTRRAQVGGRTDFAALGNILGARQTVGQNQRQGLVNLLGQAIGQGNIDQIRNLTDQIDELDVTLLENTQAIRDNTNAAFNAQTDQVNERFNFAQTVFSGAQGFFQALTQRTGLDTNPQQLSALQGVLTSLRTQQEGLLSQLARLTGRDGRGLTGTDLTNFLVSIATGPTLETIMATLDPTQQAAFRDLVSALLSNATAVESNTQAIAELGGNNAQSFSSSFWTAFRTAVFTGAGGLLPSYQMLVPGAEVGARVLTSGALMVHAGETVRPATVNRDWHEAGGDTFNLNVTSPTQVLDPTDVNRQLAFLRKTTGR